MNMRGSKQRLADKRYNLVMAEAARLAGGHTHYRALATPARDVVREKARQNICLSESYLKLDAEWNRPDIGYVYIITNPAWPGWCKLGKTSDLEGRMHTYQTGDPFSKYEYRFILETLNRHSVEKAAHSTAVVSSEANLSEWFEIDVTKLTNIIKRVEDTICTLQEK